MDSGGSPDLGSDRLTAAVVSDREADRHRVRHPAQLRPLGHDFELEDSVSLRSNQRQ